MLDRRNFFTGLAALPFLGFLAPKDNLTKLKADYPMGYIITDIKDHTGNCVGNSPMSTVTSSADLEWKPDLSINEAGDNLEFHTDLGRDMFSKYAEEEKLDIYFWYFVYYALENNLLVRVDYPDGSKEMRMRL
jgi:hypothetical protein